MARQGLNEVPIESAETHEDLLALDEALDRLKQIDRQAVELVHLRYFAGASIPDAAVMMGNSLLTADRLWSSASSLAAS